MQRNITKNHVYKENVCVFVSENIVPRVWNQATRNQFAKERGSQIKLGAEQQEHINSSNQSVINKKI